MVLIAGFVERILTCLWIKEKIEGKKLGTYKPVCEMYAHT